jgi:hypothetical protein
VTGIKMARRNRRRKTQQYNATRKLSSLSKLGLYKTTKTASSKRRQIEKFKRAKQKRLVQRLRYLKQHVPTPRRIHKNIRRGVVLKFKRLAPIKKTICKAREIRAQVLHALKKTGKKGQKPPIRRNPDIICKKRR